MYLRIEPNSGIPLHVQIVRQFRLAVAAGRLTAGERVPSVRDLAAELRINFHTVRRAYGELEQAGVLRQERGKGMFVAAPARTRPAEVEKVIRHHVERLAEDLAGTGLTAAAVEPLVVRAVRDVFPATHESETTS